MITRYCIISIKKVLKYPAAQTMVFELLEATLVDNEQSCIISEPCDVQMAMKGYICSFDLLNYWEPDWTIH